MMGDVQNPIQKAKAARVPTGKKVDDSATKETEIDTEGEEVREYLKNEAVKLEDAQHKAHFFDGIKI